MVALRLMGLFSAQLLTWRHNVNAYTVTTRRKALAATSIGTIWTTLASPSTAAPPSSPTEAIRRSAANIPGYGQTDVFYPLSFDGRWKVTREVVASDTIDPAKLPMTVIYDVRFIKSIDDGAVVADRGYNEAAYENAILNNAVRSYEWTETNPNDLRLVLGDATRKDIKVTKRATERTDDTVSSSEFQRVTTEDARGIPIISAHRVLQKWKVVNNEAIEGIEIVYDVGGNLGDPLAATPASSSPRIVSKSRLNLKRIQ